MMEQLSQALAKVNLDSSQSQSLTTQDTNEISVYTGGLTKTGLVEQTKRILNMFPKFPRPMLEELKSAFADNGFTDERIKDAVNHVRDTYEGWDKLPNIANFITFDRKIKVYNYQESIEVGQKYLVMVDIGLDSPRWAREEDVKTYKLKKWGSE